MLATCADASQGISIIWSEEKAKFSGKQGTESDNGRAIKARAEGPSALPKAVVQREARSD
jgi:hypothetical protein